LAICMLEGDVVLDLARLSDGVLDLDVVVRALGEGIEGADSGIEALKFIDREAVTVGEKGHGMAAYADVVEGIGARRFLGTTWRHSHSTHNYNLDLLPNPYRAVP